MNNISIRIRLLVGYIIIGFLVMAVGAIGYHSITDTKETLDEVGVDILPCVDYLHTIRFHTRSLVTAQRTLMIRHISQETRQQQHDNLKTSARECEVAMAAFEKYPMGAEEAARWNNFKASLVSANAESTKAISAIQAWEKDPANEQLEKNSYNGQHRSRGASYPQS